jgi:DNA-binding Xre family transcriptional regulator
MLDMRLRLPELMKARKMTTAYQLAKASNGRLTVTTAYRIVAANGHPDRIDMRTLDILCDVFGVGPGELLERDRKSA